MNLRLLQLLKAMDRDTPLPRNITFAMVANYNARLDEGYSPDDINPASIQTMSMRLGVLGEHDGEPVQTWIPVGLENFPVGHA